MNRNFVNFTQLLGLIALAITLGCAPTQTTQAPGEYVDDATLTTKIKTEIAKEQGIGDAAKIHVKTYRGVVTLSGDVDSADIAQKADRCAQRVTGVKSVQNSLQVKPKS